jgi:GMP synthase (glutamine-hydrolysing)
VGLASAAGRSGPGSIAGPAHECRFSLIAVSAGASDQEVTSHDAIPYTLPMRIMVLQARRADDPMLVHEQECFVAASGLDVAAFEWCNVVERVPSLGEVTTNDALLIGGSGHFSVADPAQAFFSPLFELLRSVVDEGHPTFGSCFGYQLLIAALGGRVIRDEANREVGSFEVELTTDGSRDPVFGDLPVRFVAQMGHLDRAAGTPDCARNLARSSRCPDQALKVEGAPIWATQFHPELDQAANLHRYNAYIQRYSAGGAEQADPFRSVPSPDASRLLPRFLDTLRG